MDHPLSHRKTKALSHPETSSLPTAQRSRHGARWLAALSIMIASLGADPAAAAAITIYDSTGSGSTAGLPFDSEGDPFLANSFMSGAQVSTLAGVSVWLSGLEGLALVGLYADDNGTPGASSWSLGTIDLTDQPGSTRFDLSPSDGWEATTLAANTRYWIGVTGLGSWAYASQPTGTGVTGEYVYSGSSAHAVDATNTPFMMQVATEAVAPTPVPAPLPVLGAIAALGWSRKLRRRIREADQSMPSSSSRPSSMTEST